MNVKPPRELEKTFRYIDIHKDDYVQSLRNAVAIRSVSSDVDRRGDNIKMANYVKRELSRIGAVVDEIDTSKGEKVKKPPVFLAHIGSDRNKDTLLVYCHYDVKAARIEDGWSADPFTLSERDGRLYGRGTSDNKGPLLCWLQSVDAYLQINKTLPINIKFLLEGMQELGSVGLEGILKARRNTFFKNIQYCCVCDSNWISANQPCVSYGLRGLCYFTVEVKASDRGSVSSGYYGGNLYEPMSDLIYLLDSLTDVEGNVAVPCVDEDIAPVTPFEENVYKEVNLDLKNLRKSLGVPKLKYEDDPTLHLMHRWRLPSLSIHGIENSGSNAEIPECIPLCVSGKFSIRLVPNQKPEKVKDLVTRYLEEAMAGRKSPNKLSVKLLACAAGWSVCPLNDRHYEIARQANVLAYRRQACLAREGGTVPIVSLLHSITGASVLLLPIGAIDDNVHGVDEKIDFRNYIHGHKMIAAYIHLLGARK